MMSASTARCLEDTPAERLGKAETPLLCRRIAITYTSVVPNHPSHEGW